MYVNYHFSMPRDPLDLEAHRAAREFIGRESFQQAFDDAFDGLDPEGHSVLMFHGVATATRSSRL